MSPTACGLRALSAAVLILGFVALCQRVQAQVVIRERVEVAPPAASGSEGGFVEGPAQEGPGRSAPVEGGAARLTTECTGGYQWRLDAAYTFGNPLVHLGGGRGRFEPSCGPITESTPFRITISPAHADYLSLSLDSTDVAGGVDSLDATLGELGDGLYFFANEATPAGVQPVWIMFRPLVDTLGSAILQLSVEPPTFYAHMDYVGLLVQGGSEGEIGFDVSAGVTYYASELYPSTPIEITLSAEGVQFGSLRTSDGTLLSSPVTTTYAELLRDGLKYVADGAKDTTVAAVPELVEVEFAIEARDTTYAPTAAFGVGGYHYRVTLGDDRIAYGDSVSVVVEPVWADGTVVPLPDDFLLHRLMIRPGIYVSDPEAARPSAFEVLRAQGAATDAEAARRGGPEPSGARLLPDLRDWHTVGRDPEEELMPCPGYGPSDPDFRPLRLSVPGAVPLDDSTATTSMRVGCYGEGHHMVTNVPYGLARSGQIHAVADAFNPEPEGGEALMSGVWAWTIYNAYTFPAYPLTVTGFQHYGEAEGLLVDPGVRFDVELSSDTLRYAEAAEVTLDAVTGPGITVPSSYPLTVSVDSLSVDYGGGLVFTYTLGHLVHTGTEERGTTLTGVPYEDLQNGLVEFVADGTTAVGGFEPAVVRVEGEQPIDGATPAGARTALVREAWLDVEPSYDSLYYGGSRVLQAMLTDELGAVPYDTTRAFEVWAYQDDGPAGVLVHDGTAEQDPEFVGAAYGDLLAGRVRFLADTTGGPPVARAPGRTAPRALRGRSGGEDGPVTRRQATAQRARRAHAARQAGRTAATDPTTHGGAGARSASLTEGRYVGLELVSEDYALYGWIDLLVLPSPPVVRLRQQNDDPVALPDSGGYVMVSKVRPDWLLDTTAVAFDSSAYVGRAAWPAGGGVTASALSAYYDPHTYRPEVTGLPDSATVNFRIEVLRGGVPVPIWTEGWVGGDSLAYAEYDAVGEMQADSTWAYRGERFIRFVSNARPPEMQAGTSPGCPSPTTFGCYDDEVAGTQTVRVELGDEVRVTALLSTAPGATATFPVGGPAADTTDGARSAQLHFAAVDNLEHPAAADVTTRRMNEDWAQAAVRFELLGNVGAPDIANVAELRPASPGTGATAPAGGTFRVRAVSATNDTTSVAVPVSAGDSLTVVAERIASDFRALGVDAVATRHAIPLRAGGTDERALVVVNPTQPMLLALDADTTGIRTAVRPLRSDSLALGVDLAEREATLYAEVAVVALNYGDRDPSTIDLYVIPNSAVGRVGVRAFAFPDAYELLAPHLMNSAALRAVAADGSDQTPMGETDSDPVTASHEVGHVLFEAFAHESDSLNVMSAQTQPFDEVPEGRKRFTGDQQRAALANSERADPVPLLSPWLHKSDSRLQAVLERRAQPGGRAAFLPPNVVRR